MSRPVNRSSSPNTSSDGPSYRSSSALLSGRSAMPRLAEATPSGVADVRIEVGDLVARVGARSEETVEQRGDQGLDAALERAARGLLAAHQRVVAVRVDLGVDQHEAGDPLARDVEQRHRDVPAHRHPADDTPLDPERVEHAERVAGVGLHRHGVAVGAGAATELRGGRVRRCGAGTPPTCPRKASDDSG